LAQRAAEGVAEPQVIRKHQRRLAGFDEKSLSHYANEMTTSDIQQMIKELYGVEVSPSLIAELTASRDSAFKMIYLAINEASKRWTKSIHNWKEVLNHFAIMFQERIPKDLR
jgi:transposase-like protein